MAIFLWYLIFIYRHLAISLQHQSMNKYMKDNSHIQSNRRKVYALEPASRRFTFSSSNLIALSFSLSAPCRVVIVSTSLFIRSMLESGAVSDSNIGPLPRSSHSDEMSSKEASIALTVAKLSSLTPFNWLLNVFCFKPHLMAKALSAIL